MIVQSWGPPFLKVVKKCIFSSIIDCNGKHTQFLEGFDKKMGKMSFLPLQVIFMLLLMCQLQFQLSYAYFDFGTNYCNLRNLMDGAGLSRIAGYGERTSKGSFFTFLKSLKGLHHGSGFSSPRSWSRSISILATLPVLRKTYKSCSQRSPPSADTLAKNVHKSKGWN